MDLSVNKQILFLWRSLEYLKFSCPILVSKIKLYEVSGANFEKAMNQFPPGTWVYHFSNFKFFRKFAEIFAAQGAPPVSSTPVANGQKFSIRKFLIILFGHLWVVELTYISIFAFKFTLRCLHPDIVSIICHRCHYFAAFVIDTGGAPWLANISATMKKFEMTLMLFLGVWGATMGLIGRSQSINTILLVFVLQ